MATEESEKDYGWWHRAASENLYQATQESKRNNNQLAIRFTNSAKVLEQKAYAKASGVCEKLLALELAHACDLLLAILDGEQQDG